MKKVFLLIFVVFFAFINLAFAASYPTATGFVNDFAQAYSPTFKSSLEADLQSLQNTTGNEIVVVTIKNLGNQTIEEYAVNLFKGWKIGQKNKDNGLLLLISISDRQVRFEVGYGLEPILTDGRMGEIIRNYITPEFKNGNYEQGTQAAINQVKIYLENPTISPRPAPVNKNNFPIGWFAYLAFMAIVYFASFLGRTKEIYVGALVGFFIGFVFGGLTWAIISGVFGLILDAILSANYQKLNKSGKPTGFFGSLGGFSSKGGGFGGGRSGGGGASGGW